MLFMSIMASNILNSIVEAIDGVFPSITVTRDLV